MHEEATTKAWVEYAQVMQELMLAKKAGNRLSRERGIVEQRIADNDRDIKRIGTELDIKRLALEKAAGIFDNESDLTVATLQFLRDVFSSKHSD